MTEVVLGNGWQKNIKTNNYKAYVLHDEYMMKMG